MANYYQKWTTFYFKLSKQMTSLKVINADYYFKDNSYFIINLTEM